MRGESRSAEPEAASASSHCHCGCARRLSMASSPSKARAPSSSAAQVGSRPSCFSQRLRGSSRPAAVATWRARSGRASCESATPRRSRRGGSCSPGAAVARRAGGMIPSRQDCPFASVSYKLTFLFIYSRLSISLGSYLDCCLAVLWAVLGSVAQHEPRGQRKR